MATRLFLVVILSRKTHFLATRLFLVVILSRKTHFLATRLFLVVILRWETPFFGDETLSRHHFKPENFTFWRRDSFSSSF
ncbi:hypothetical protein NSS89_16030 [Caldifermentibacillus hisashii]|uniref:hypothetical protein n=1 Tax=Caldifermentibacillus hisashii TaxID=996558 RepID=UPI0031FCFA9B